MADVYEKVLKTGSLTITKTFTGDTDGLTEAQMNGVTFKVTGPNDYEETFTYADMEEGGKTLEGLALGEYRVEESNQFVDGHTCATTYQVGAESRQTVNLTEDGAIHEADDT